jgi:hypothetical protein
MNSFRMKALSLAVLSLAGLGMAGSAFAVCPQVSSHIANSTPGGGGAWTSQSVGGGAFVTILNTGLNGTGCSLGIDLGTTPTASAHGFVQDTSPSNETRYRGRFYFNDSALTLTAANYQFVIFNAFADTAPGTFNTDEVRVSLIGGGSPAIRFKVADATQVSGFKIITSTLPAAITPGTYYLEFDMNQGAGSGAVVGPTCTACAAGAPGCFRYWLTPAGAASSDGSPTGTCSVSNAGWSGVTQANLGLFSPSALFRQFDNTDNAIIVVDEFDSRRQTFIGQ